MSPSRRSLALAAVAGVSASIAPLAAFAAPGDASTIDPTHATSVTVHKFSGPASTTTPNNGTVQTMPAANKPTIKTPSSGWTGS